MPLVALLAFGLVLISANGCGKGDGATAASSPFSPKAFADDSFAELATDGASGLWMAVAGYDRKDDFGVRLFQKGATWKSFPAPPQKPRGDSPISIAVAKLDGFNSEPCLGYDTHSSTKPVVTCWTGRAWNDHPAGGVRDTSLLQIASDPSGGLLALFLDHPTSEQATYRLLRLEVGGWASEGPPVAAPSTVARLGANASDANGQPPTIGVTTQSARAIRYVLRLVNGHWQKTGASIRGAGMGPMVGGPLIMKGGILFPVTDTNVTPWAFSVQPARFESRGPLREATELSVGDGHAQGRLDPVGRDVWATWQEDEPLRSGGFQVGIFAAKLHGDGSIDEKAVLWRGKSIGPGSTQIVEFHGQQFVLYMPGSANGKGLRTVVRPLPSRSASTATQPAR